MRYFAASIFVLFFACLSSAPVYALDKVDPYICPTMVGGSGTDCFLEAIPQTYTMCRQIKSIEVLEYGLSGAQEGVNGAKTEGCVEKHKLSITRPYQAALREAARNKDEVVSIRKLYDTWIESLGKLVPGERETDDGYKQRVSRPYGDFNEQITLIRAMAVAPVAALARKTPVDGKKGHADARKSVGAKDAVSKREPTDIKHSPAVAKHSPATPGPAVAKHTPATLGPAVAKDAPATPAAAKKQPESAS